MMSGLPPIVVPAIAVPAIVAFYGAGINLCTFAAFWIDKRAAVRRRRRISEARLLQLSALGGTPAAFAARHLLRHKSRKQPFSTCLFAIAAVQAGLGLGVVWLLPA